MLYKRTTLSLLVAQLLASYALAETPVFSLGEIRVVATPVGNETLGSSTIEIDQIREQDRNTVGEALDLLAGINTSKQGQRNEQMTWVRGFNLRQVPIFLDGIPIYVPYDGYVDLGRFSNFDLSRIEVSKGFSSSLYGSNTLGGAINLVSRRPVKAFEGEVGGGVNFTNHGELGGEYSYVNVGTNQGAWYFQLSTSFSNQDYYRLPASFAKSKGEDGGLRDNSYQHDSKINLKIGLTPNASDEYSLNYISQHGVKGDPPYAGSAAGVSPVYWQWPYWDKESIYFISSTNIGDHTLKFRVYHDTFKNSLDVFDNANYNSMAKSSSYASYYNDYTNGFSIQDDIKLTANNLLRGSYNFKEDIHRENNAGEAVRHFKDLTQSFALEDTHAFNQKLSLVTGLSFDKRDSLQAQNYNSSTKVVSDFARDNNTASNGQIGLFYQLNDRDAIHATVARKSRFPTIKDRYSYKMGKALPNPDLKMEEANNYEIGYSGKWAESWKFEGNLFHSDVTNLIQSTTLTTMCGSSRCIQNQNVGKSSADGVELGISGSLAHWDLSANYTYLQRKNLSTPGLFLTDTPRHKVFTSAVWNAGGGWSVTGSAEAYSRRYSSSDGTQIAPGFMVTNLKMGYRLPGGTLLEAGVRNLFDRLYEYTEGYPEAGRTYFVQFNMPL
jgi:iron complex outermembrane receptor protein